MEAKSKWSSWSIWFGIVQIIYAIIGGLSGQIELQTVITLVTTGLGTIGLRFKTNRPII